MPEQKDMRRGRLATRLITFYAIIAAIGVAVLSWLVAQRLTGPGAIT